MIDKEYQNNEKIIMVSDTTIAHKANLKYVRLPNLTKCFGRVSMIATLLFLLSGFDAISQVYQASPANWMYPAGNAANVRKVEFPSAAQSIDSMIVKWSTEAISGDVTPLIGNIINNQRLFDEFPFAPNEMTAVINNNIVIVDGGGRVVQNPIEGDFIDRVSVLIDTLQTGLSDDNRNPLILGLETIENISTDSIAYSYLVGYDHSDSTAKVVQRMAIDMRRYAPNVHASIKPIFGRQNGGNISIYATVNTNRPNVDDVTNGQILPESVYLRGFTQFDANRSFDNYPFSDIGDKEDINRGEFLPQVNRGNPSTAVVDGSIITLMPSYPTPGFDFQQNNVLTNFTVGNIPTLMGFNLSGIDINSAGLGIDGIFLNGEYTSGNRPLMQNYWVRMFDPTQGAFREFVLMAEEYSGLEGSEGTARLHLFESNGDDFATRNSPSDTTSAIIGGQNHGWSIAVGDIDGNAANEQLPFFPNNRGDEIVVTQSSKDAAFPSSKIMVLKINPYNSIPKPSPPNVNLQVFDTVFTQQLSGWVAAVNDLDAAPDGKEEILIADNSRIMVLRAKNYTDLNFRLGFRFDTLMVREFAGETVSNASIADMDGDGKNDIIVTTFERTYVIGAPLSSVLSFVSPVIDSVNVCVGDSLDIEWRNIIQSSNTLDLSFIETDPSGNPLDTFLLKTDIPNPTQDVSYSYLVDTTIAGKSGYFMLFSAEAADKVFATSGFVIIQSTGGDFTLSPSFEPGYYQIGEQISIDSESLCIDSLGAEISPDGTEWFPIGLDYIVPGSSSSVFQGEIPCIDVFDISSELLEEEVQIRTISSRGGFRFYSDPMMITLRPQYVPFAIDTAINASPSKIIQWDYNDFSNASDDLVVMASYDGAVYSMVGTKEIQDQEFVWHVPSDIPETVYLRIATSNGCVAVDTVIGDSRPKFIHSVAPNPFNPYETEASIVYELSEDANVTIEIFDQNDRRVAMPLSSQMRFAGTIYTEWWNGVTYDNNLARNGLYYIKLTTDIGITEIYPIFIYK